MQIIFYKTKDEPEKVHKTLTDAYTLTGTCRDSIDVYSPIVSVPHDISGYNYMYIPAFDKYYFINGCTIIRNGIYRIEGVEEDVLMSLKDELLALEAIIDKTAKDSLGDEYIDDGSFITSCKQIEQVYNFSGGFNTNPDFILITAGAIT